MLSLYLDIFCPADHVFDYNHVCILLGMAEARGLDASRSLFEQQRM